MCVEHHIHTKASTVQDSDRWYSHTPCGQEFCQILAQWVWNLRLELGQKLSSSELRTTEFAKVRAVEPTQACESVPVSQHTPAVTYGPAQWARPSFTGGFPGSAFPRNPMGRCAAPPIVRCIRHPRRPERDGSTRGLVCRSHWPLPLLSFACTVSRKQRHDQATTRECGVVAALLLPLLLVKRRPNRSLVLHWCGKTGHALASGEHGSSWSAAKRFAWKAPPSQRQSPPPLRVS